MSEQIDKIEAFKILNKEATKLQIRKALMALNSLRDKDLADRLNRTRGNMSLVMKGKNTSRLMQDEVSEILGVPRKAIFD